MAKWPRFDPDADRRLARALSEGGEESLTTLYDIYATRLCDYCSSLIREQHTASDIVHDTLIDAARRARRMRDRVRLRAWLYGSVRRRCLQQVRHPALRWNWTDEPDDKARELLEAAFDRLDFVDQEALLLALRHDLDDDDLGAMLGIPPRRANIRLARAQARAENAIADAQRTLARRCADAVKATNGNGPTDEATSYTAANDRATNDRAVADTGQAATDMTATVPAAAAKAGGTDSGTAERDVDRRPIDEDEAAVQEAAPDDLESILPPAGEALSEHVAACADCRRHGGLSLAAMLDLLPAPELPPTLRHRVIHTGTDPELAGYRADIAARGGTLNADGLPRQPDISSHFARRWLFAGGGMVGALIAALVAAFLIGPGAPIPDLIWPSYQPQPSTTPVSPSRQQPPVAPPPTRPGGAQHPGSTPQMNQSQTMNPSTTSSTGILAVSPDAVTFARRENSAKLTLSAARGPVTWRAAPSTNKFTLSIDHGRIPAGDKAVVTIALNRGVLELPGSGTITITDAENRRHVVTVSWVGSLL